MRLNSDDLDGLESLVSGGFAPTGETSFALIIEIRKLRAAHKPMLKALEEIRNAMDLAHIRTAKHGSPCNCEYEKAATEIDAKLDAVLTKGKP